MGRLFTLRSLLGREGAQNAVRKAPYLMMPEKQNLGIQKWKNWSDLSLSGTFCFFVH